jgi:hypothetical protein
MKNSILLKMGMVNSMKRARKGVFVAGLVAIDLCLSGRWGCCRILGRL